MTNEQLKKLKTAYTFQKSYSKRRIDRNGNPIEWKLTFDEWLDIWISSGHLEQRGTHRGGYVMARYNDIGPYSHDNVSIILHSENISFAKSYWKMTDEQKQHLSKINTGKTYSLDHCHNLSEIHLKRWAEVDRSKLKKWTPTDEQRNKMKKPRGARPTTTCPHCGCVGAVANLKRYHFDNCRDLTDSNK